MIRVRQVKVPLLNKDILKYLAKKLNVNTYEIKKYNIIKESIDARHNEIYLIYELDVLIDNEDRFLSSDVIKSPDETFKFKITGTKKLENRPVIVGAGPAGLFAAYLLAENGYKPLIIEQGEKVEDRVKTVEGFFNGAKLNTFSNVQFGEGGAGTFSDGKLNTLVKDKEFIGKKVFEIFIKHGAKEDIIYKNKPHIGTDLLRNIIVSMREYIIKMGGEFKYNTKLTNLVLDEKKICGIIVNGNIEIKTDVLILAIGHSSRDTFKMLLENNLNMEAKPFAMGVRVEHLQEWINNNQYGKYAKYLEPASYKVTYKAKSGRGVYSFCMCPGGYVVNASSEEGRLAINGMSNHARDTLNSNSAIIVTVSPKDFGEKPLDGIKLQEELESKAYKALNGLIPMQLFKDFKNNTKSSSYGIVKPITKGNYGFYDINLILPTYISNDIKEAMTHFGKIIKNFDHDDCILSAVESRTSSPVRIIRDENFSSNISGIYPIGEGAGYAGGITTSAMDGVKVALKIASIYKN